MAVISERYEPGCGDGEKLARPLKVLVCPDQPGWAFDNISDAIVRNAPDSFIVEKYYLGVAADRDLSRLLETIIAENIDVVHVFWREDLFEFLSPASLLTYAKKLEIPVADVIDSLGSRALTTSVYDHLHLEEYQVQERLYGFNMIDGYSVSSERLQRIYLNLRGIPAPDAVITDGVSLQSFRPAARSGGRSGQPPVIGWAGNSRWGHLEGNDPKGFYRLFEPSIALLKEMNVSFETDVADSQVRRRDFSEMPSYYAGLDVLVCTSAAEGTPNPILEAMACGVAIVSTDVGIVPEAFGPEQSAFIVREPTPQNFAAAIKALLEDASRLESVRDENTKQIQAWAWEKRAKCWWPFWLNAYRRACETKAKFRRANALLNGCLVHDAHRRSKKPAGLGGVLGKLIRS